jgi:hypothetical protein
MLYYTIALPVRGHRCRCLRLYQRRRHGDLDRQSPIRCFSDDVYCRVDNANHVAGIDTHVNSLPLHKLGESS